MKTGTGCSGSCADDKKDTSIATGLTNDTFSIAISIIKSYWIINLYCFLWKHSCIHLCKKKTK